jgi:hypothetical protein
MYIENKKVLLRYSVQESHSYVQKVTIETENLEQTRHNRTLL